MAFNITMQSLPDYLEPNLALVFVGFNPGDPICCESATTMPAPATSSGRSCTSRDSIDTIRSPTQDDARLIEHGIGLTDLVKRSTPSSADLSSAEAHDWGSASSRASS